MSSNLIKDGFAELHGTVYATFFFLVSVLGTVFLMVTGKDTTVPAITGAVWAATYFICREIRLNHAK